VGRQAWVRWEQIALHALAEPGKFATDPLHHLKNVRFLGPPGVGKPHLAQAIGYDKIKNAKSKPNESSTAEPAS